MEEASSTLMCDAEGSDPSGWKNADVPDEWLLSSSGLPATLTMDMR